MPSHEEIKQAVWCCDSSRAPDPDGYNFNFVKRCWNQIGEDFIDYVSSFFVTDCAPNGANITWVTLAPKIDEARTSRIIGQSVW